MNKRFDTILVLGLGKVGHLVSLLLHNSGFKVTGADLHNHRDCPFTVIKLDSTDTHSLGKTLQEFDAVVSCLPYHFNIAVARLAAENKTHYFDLTEDVQTTKEIMELSGKHKTIMAPQCGLAPGFIAIIGASLAEGFARIRNIKLRVGALPKHPTGLLGYAFNWSPEGVVNEYLNDCEVIENSKRKWVSPLEWVETIVIHGNVLEAFTTSGGLGTMCDTYEGRVENLDYKSIRYPGHAKLMNFLLHELLMREDRVSTGEILVNAKPPVNEDVVYIHASAEGWINGNLARKEFVKVYHPIEINDNAFRTIAWTTAASVCAVVEMAATGAISDSGFIRQEEISFDRFIASHNGRLFALKEHGGKIT